MKTVAWFSSTAGGDKSPWIHWKWSDSNNDDDWFLLCSESKHMDAYYVSYFCSSNSNI